MKSLDIYFDNTNVEIIDIVKKINFVSEEIENIEIISYDKIRLSVSEKADTSDILDRVKDMIYTESKRKEICVIYSNKQKKGFSSVNTLDFDFMGGVTISSRNLIDLFEFFDGEFKQMALENFECSEERMYPVLLNIDEYIKTGYMRNSPQYSFFCEGLKEDMRFLEHVEKDACEGKLDLNIKYPQYALSPSACFHSYIEFKNKELDGNLVLTFKQNVFRNEGRLNYRELGRLRDYHVREIVFIGDDEFVKNSRQTMIDESIKFLTKLNLSAEVSIANDPFILPKMQKYKKIQLMEKTKYELQLFVNEEKSIAAASYNLHGDAFTTPFNISGVNNRKMVTGCVGFGLERWLIAFLCQYGENKDNWPSYVKEKLKNIR